MVLLWFIYLLLFIMSYLYQYIIQNEDMYTIFLKIHLLPTDQIRNKIKNQTIYDGELKKVLKNSHARPT